MDQSEPLSMSAIDPLGSAATRARTSADGPARTGLTPARRELLSAYAALDPKLHEELEIVEPGLVPAVDDPAAAVVRAAELWDATPDRPRIHPLQLAQAALRVFDGRTPDSLPDLTPIVRVLAGPEHADRIPEVLPAIQTELLNRPERDLKLRWTAFQSAAFEALTTELKEVPVAWCTPGLRAYNGEIVARVETRLVVKKATDLDTLAAAVVPDNWPVCNDFFCSLVPRAGRDADCTPPCTGGTLGPPTRNWRGVYQERVGHCPDGWFPDTYLVFTWRRTPTQTILMYELAPRRPGDRTVLRVDEGYLQVSQINSGTFDVSTVKNLLFDDKYLPGGGQALGNAACQLGWLDYSINQFTVCAGKLATGSSVEGKPGPQTLTGTADPENGDPGRLDGDLQDVLKQCQANITQSVTETNDQLSRIVARIQAGQYGPDAAVLDASEVLARAIRDSARSAIGHAELVGDYVDLIRRLTRRVDDQP